VPQITSIEPQKKNKNRYNIFIDGIFAFGVDTSSILSNNLKTGKKFTQEQLNKIYFKEELNKYMDKVMRYLGYRMRSEKEVVDYLTKKISEKENIKFNEARESKIIEQILIKLKKYKYINDLEFANWFYKSKIKSRPTAKLPIKIELIKKGISVEIIEKIMENFPSETQLAKKAIEKKIKSWTKLDDVNLKKKVYTYLSARGFNYDTIRDTFAFLKKKI